MKFTQPFDIWQVPVELLAKTQPGQWIYAGDPDHAGRFLGVNRAGVVCVAWKQNARNFGNVREYNSRLRRFARG